MIHSRVLRDILATQIATWNHLLPRYPVSRTAAPMVAICVYRERNVKFVQRMLDQLRSADVRLHALQSVDPSLKELTRNQGPGLRMPLLQRLIDVARVPDDAWIVIFDDDATFVKTGGTRFLDYAEAAALDLAGPAIQHGQPWSHPHTLVKPLRTARQVGLVEIGPVIAISPRARPLVLPISSSTGMGWGVDVSWAAIARREDLRLGILDATPILHHGDIGVAYDRSEETAHLDAATQAAGITGLHELTKTTGAPWRPWQRRPPWLAP